MKRLSCLIGAALALAPVCHAGGGARQEGARPDGLGLPQLHRPARTDADPPGGDDPHAQRRQHRREGLRARRVGARQPVSRCRGQRLARHGLDGVGLLDRQGHRFRDVRLGAFRPRRRRIPGVDETRRRREADEGAARQVRRRGHDLRRDLARGLGLVPQGDQDARRPEGPEDALLRPRRQRDAEARRQHPAAAGGRDLPGAAAGHHRRHRVLDAGDGPDARLPPGGQVLLLPRLAPAGHDQRADHQQEEVGRVQRHAEGHPPCRLRRDDAAAVCRGRGGAVQGDEGDPGQGRAAQEVAAELPRCLRESLGRGGRRAGGQEP